MTAGEVFEAQQTVMFVWRTLDTTALWRLPEMRLICKRHNMQSVRTLLRGVKQKIAFTQPKKRPFSDGR